jgi:hypothetical protein
MPGGAGYQDHLWPLDRPGQIRNYNGYELVERKEWHVVVVEADQRLQ